MLYDIGFEFKLQDMWVGVFWKKKNILRGVTDITMMDIWICFVPCVPLHIVLLFEE